MIEIFEIDSEDSNQIYFCVRGEKLLQFKDRVLINYLDGKTFEGYVIFTESRALIGNKASIQFEDYKIPDQIISYELLG